MATTNVTGSQFAVAQDTVRDTTARVVSMLRGVKDQDRRAVGEWTIGETAAHLRTVAAIDATVAAGIEAPAHLEPVLERAAAVGLSEVEDMNALTLECEPERNPAVLAERIERQVDELLVATAQVDGAERVRWLGGLTCSTTGVLAHLVSEMLIHGRDIARAEGRSFDVPSSAARLFFETFFFDVLHSPEIAEFSENRAATMKPLAWELRLRGSAPVTFSLVDGQLEVATDGRPRRVDLHISADPSAMLLLMFDRISPVSAGVRRQVVVWGRRPWRVRRLMGLIAMP